MAILSKEEFNARMAEVFKESDDNTLQIIEDFTDTYNDLYERSENSRSAEEVEKTWREKYRKRFFGEGMDEEEKTKEIKNENEEDLKEEAKPKTFTDLFEEREG